MVSNTRVGRFDLDVLLRLGIIAVLLAACLLVGLRPSRLYPLALGGVVGLLIFRRWPGLGVLLSVVGGIVVPFNGPSGLNVAMLGIGLLVGLWLAEMVVVDHALRIPASAVNVPVLANALVIILAYAIGQLPWYRAPHAPLDSQLGGIAIYVLSVGAFLVMAYRVEQVKWLEMLTWIAMFFGFLYTLTWLVPGVGHYVERFIQHGTTGSILFVWFIALACGQAFFHTQLRLPIRLLFLVAGLIGLYTLRFYLGDWKSGWMPAMATFGVLVVLRFPRLTPFLLLGLTVPLLSLVAGAVASDTYSVDTRFDAWRILFEIVKINPMTGLGPSNYYFYTPLFPIRGYSVNFNSHNQYIDMVAQTGVLGLLVFFWFAWRVGVLGWSLRQRVPEGFPKAYVHCALAGLVGTVIAGIFGDWFLPFVYNVGLFGFRSSVLAWLFLGGLVMLEQRTLCPATPLSSPPPTPLPPPGNRLRRG